MVLIDVTRCSWDNTISVVETLTPNKTDVLPFLTAGAEAPERWARVIIMFAATEEPYLQDFQVRDLLHSYSSSFLNSGLGRPTSGHERYHDHSSRLVQHQRSIYPAQL